MSGGSYDYLCFATDIEELGRKREALERMAARLGGWPWAASALDETNHVLAMIRRLESVLNSSGIQGVWRAVEWHDSGDSSEETVRTAVRAFELDGANSP